MPVEGLEELYDDNYFVGASDKWREKRRVVDVRKRFQMISKHVSGPKPRFLEVGCGPGLGIQEAFRRKWQVYGQDVTDVFAQTLREKYNAEIYIGELDQAGYDDNFFDVVYLDSVIEHVPDPEKMLKEIERILKPGGSIYIITPNADALINGFRDLLLKILGRKKTTRISGLEQPYHITGFTRSSFKTMCDNNGRKIKRFQIYSGWNEWRKHTDRGLNVLLRYLLLYFPVHLTGEIIGKGITIEALISKSNRQQAVSTLRLQTRFSMTQTKRG